MKNVSSDEWAGDFKPGHNKGHFLNSWSKALWLAAPERRFTDFSQIIGELREFLAGTEGLVPETNQIVRTLHHFDVKTTEYILVDYSHLSMEAVHFLLDASLRLWDWTDVRKEIEHNIKEEKGLKTRGVPHLEIMRQGYRDELRIETDGRAMGPATKAFLGKLRKVFRTESKGFLCGSLVALEGTAVPEFHTVDHIVTHFCKLKGQDGYTGKMAEYIDGHKDFEIGHEQGLIDSVEKYITPDQQGKFIKGYVTVCLTLAEWWRQMASDRMIGVIGKF
jgi:hypothetical protein